MNDIITVVGNAATQPEAIQTSTNKSLTRLRVASPKRRFNPERNQWEEVSTNWFTVRAWGKLAEHVKASVQKGQQLIVQGRLKIETNKAENGTTYTNVSIDADTVGVSLQFGTASFQRAATTTAATGESDWARPDDAAEVDRGDPVPVGAEEAPPF
ncbi:MAG TPA: single-stranded DNA-binding protein [Candidatus Agrococcus pullicola]|uniref:Single-stranded DNA-binding protein n=1 Tax=Candidatus Agrococcus pullicola TaxID=2838429 RepID=A0A9D2CAF7_9MICO|nr:single-stranded DNA-binding protein [Candidatus Agrococcus pullicola]